jgi:hypothetical protein
MAADPLIYCLEEITDYDQFERLCHDLMALDGFRGIEPLGGSKDKGRDAIHQDRARGGEKTIFAYSVREDWQTKLHEDAKKVRDHGHTCDRLVFLCTASYTAGERDAAIREIRTEYGWPLELYGLERLRTMLATTHREVVALHPQVFCPPFFPNAGGLSIAFSLDHIVIDHIDSDAGLAQWLARRLTLAGFHVWCRGLAPMAGSSTNDTVQGLLSNRAFRYLCVLSPASVSDPNFTLRRSMAQTISLQRKSEIVLPVFAEPFTLTLLDEQTRRLVPARFENNWSTGLKEIEEALAAAGCPRNAEGSRELAIKSYFPADIVLNEPETVASNLFRVIVLPKTILRYQSRAAVEQSSPELREWGCRWVDSRQFLSFNQPPVAVARKLGLTPKGGALCESVFEIDGIRINDLKIELLKKSLYAECLRRGLLYCENRLVHYFPFGLLKHDHLTFRKLNNQATFFNVAGERTHGKGQLARKYRYHLAPVFAPKDASDGGFEVIVRIRLRLTDADGKLFVGRISNSRRKKICKSWWNEEWLSRTMGVMQFLANGNPEIVLGANDDERIAIAPLPRTWTAPVRLNEAALSEAIEIRKEEEPHLRDDGDDDDDE